MRLRNIVLAAVVAAPLAWSSAPVSAQQRGLERAAVATAHADSVVAANNNNQGNRPAEPPKGIVKRFGEGLAGILPPGIRRWFSPEPAAAPAPEPEPEPLPEPEPQPEPEPEPPPPCVTQLVYVGGVPMLQDCNGNLTPMFPG